MKVIKASSLAYKPYIFVFFLGLIFAQQGTIVGTVVSDVDQMPIHGADVYLEKLSLGATSQVDGYFTINDIPSGEVIIRVSMIGFKDVDRAFILEKGIHDLGKISMLRDTLKIDEVVVDAHHELQPKSFLSNIDVAGNKYHKVLKSTLALTLQEETGLSIRSMGQGSAQPVLRGYKGHRFLLTDDGIATGDLSSTSIDHAVSTDMGAYSGVEIIRGPEALLYGSNTIGGVIDLSRDINNQNRFKKLMVQTLLGTESANKGHFQSVTVKAPFKSNHQLRFSFLNRDLGNQISPKPYGTLKNTQSINQELHGSYMYFGNDFYSSLSLEQFNTDYGIPGSSEGHINGVDISMYRKTQKFNFHKDVSIAGFQTFDFDQRYIDYRHSESVTGSSFKSVILAHQILSLNAKLSGNKKSIGSLLKIRDFQAYEFYWTPDAQEVSISLYGLYEKEISHYTLQSSFRLENQSIIPDITSEYFYANLDINQINDRNFLLFSAATAIITERKNWELSLGSMFTSRAPSIEDLYSDGPHLGVYNYEIGLPELGAEHTYGLEGSLGYMADRAELKITSYQNYSPNYHLSKVMGAGYEPGADWIEWGSGAAGWLYIYQMSGLEVYIHGYESEFHYNLNEIIGFDGSFSATRGKNLTDNSPLYYIPPDRILLSTEVNLNPFSINLMHKKVFSQNRVGLYEEATPGYETYNLTGTYTIRDSWAIHKFILQIDNVFDRKYYNHLSKIKSIMPEKGRSLNIQYRMVF